MILRHLDLFAGIGGFTLAGECSKIVSTVGFSEIDPYASQILEKNFRKTKNYGDIRQITRETLGQDVDLITGGFPCQPFSVAGKRKGKADDRHLWPEMLRVIKEFRPTWVIGENVAGFVNMALDSTLADLEAEGYTTRAFIIPACAVGAQHRRDRVWIIANSRYSNKGCKSQGLSFEQLNSKTPFEWAIEGDRLADENIASSNSKYNGHSSTEISGRSGEGNDNQPKGEKSVEQLEGCDSQPTTSDSDSWGLERTCSKGKESVNDLWKDRKPDWSKNWIEAAPILCGVANGLSNRVHRIKCLGNSIVPQIPQVILRYIGAIETIQK